MSSQVQAETARRIPALDGVRGVAVLLVFVAHLLEGVFPHDRKLFSFLPHGGGGGFIGVQLFFVLSGYLITGILRNEMVSGTFSFRSFYERRARRLLPALVSVCLFYLVAALVWLPAEERTAAFGAIIRALTYTTNLHRLWRGVPDSNWLRHCWSLAVEEQFYILWPPALLLLFKLRRSGAVYAALAVIVGTTLLRLVPVLAPLSYEVLRWDALMFGAALALARPPVPHLIRWLGVPIVAWYALRPTNLGFSTWDHLITALGSALFVDLALHSTWLDNRVLRYFGRISYALYLWHVLLLRFDVSGWIAGPLSVAISELSYRFLETKFLVHRPR